MVKYAVVKFNHIRNFLSVFSNFPYSKLRIYQQFDFVSSYKMRFMVDAMSF